MADQIPSGSGGYGGGAGAIYRQAYRQAVAGGLTYEEEQRKQFLLVELGKAQNERQRLQIEKAKGRATVISALASAWANLAQAEAEGHKANSAAQQSYVTAYVSRVEARKDLLAHVLHADKTGQFRPVGDMQETTLPQLQRLDDVGRLGKDANVKELVAPEDVSIDPATVAGELGTIIRETYFSPEATNLLADQLNKNVGDSQAERYRQTAWLAMEAGKKVRDGLIAIEVENGLERGSLSNDRAVQEIVLGTDGTAGLLPPEARAVLAAGSEYQAAHAGEVSSAQVEWDGFVEEGENLARAYNMPVLAEGVAKMRAFSDGDMEALKRMGFGDLTDAESEPGFAEQVMIDDLKALQDKAGAPGELERHMNTLRAKPGWDAFVRMYGFTNEVDAALWAARDSKAKAAFNVVMGAHAAGRYDEVELQGTLRMAGLPTSAKDVGHPRRVERRASMDQLKDDMATRKRERQQERQQKRVGERVGPAIEEFERTDPGDAEPPGPEARLRKERKGIRKAQTAIAQRLGDRFTDEMKKRVDADTSTLPATGTALAAKDRKKEDENAEPEAGYAGYQV